MREIFKPTMAELGLCIFQLESMLQVIHPVVCYTVDAVVVIVIIVVVMAIDPLHVMGMQPIWRTKQKEFSLLFSCKKILLFYLPDWQHFHGCARGL